MPKTITLRRPATCAECGADLPAGTQARYYNAHHIYGLDCHDYRPRRRIDYSRRNGGFTCKGELYSNLDPVGIYAPDGTKMGSTCGCEDYPCCGH